MAFKLPFGKKKKDDEFNDDFGMESEIPISQVLNMRARGVSNSQIANQLRASGYSLSQIKDAMSQADIKGAVSESSDFGGGQFSQQTQQFPQQQQSQQQPSQQFPKQPQQSQQQPSQQFPQQFPGDNQFEDDSFQEEDEFPQMPSVPERPPFPQQQFQPEQSSFQTSPDFQKNTPSGMDNLVDELQRIVESIIEEKWKGVEGKIDDLNVWKAKIDEKVDNFESIVSQLNSRVDEFSRIISSKSEEYKDTVKEVGTQMNAIDKMMGKLVPSLADEIKELRDVVEQLKKKKK